MNDKPNSFSEYFEAAKAHPAYWEEAIELAVSEGTVKSLAKQIAKIHSNKLSKIELKFMVVPEQLASLAYVPSAKRVKIIDPEAIFLMGILGESGRKLVEAGIEFYFEGGLAQKLIDKQIAVEVKDV